MKARRSTAPVKFYQTSERALKSPLEMLKMKVDPAMCMKTQATMTKCHAIKTPFYRNLPPLCVNRQKSVGFWPKMHSQTIIRGEARPLEPASPKIRAMTAARPTITTSPRWRGFTEVWQWTPFYHETSRGATHSIAGLPECYNILRAETSYASAA